MELSPNCPDCNVEIDQPHKRMCDVAICLHNGEQMLTHQLGTPELIHTDGDCIPDVWTGFWPGELEAALLGYWCYWEDPLPNKKHGSWIACGSEHEGARPDLNRYYRETAFHPEERIRIPVKRVP